MTRKRRLPSFLIPENRSDNPIALGIVPNRKGGTLVAVRIGPYQGETNVASLTAREARQLAIGLIQAAEKAST